MSNDECSFTAESFNKCPQCKNEVSQNDIFCDQCGTKIQNKICKDCDHINRSIAIFCAECSSSNLEIYNPTESTSWTEEDYLKLV